MTLLEFVFLTRLWICSHSPAIGFGQALTRVLQFSAVLAAEDPKVCLLVCNTVSLDNCCLIAPKVTTHTLGENGGRVLHVIGDPQTNTLERQSKGGGQGVRSVFNSPLLEYLLTCIAEVGTPVLPRFFLVTSQSGVKSMTLSLDGARERVVGPNQAVVQCASAVWTYRYRNGYTVTLRGPFVAHVVVTPNATQNGAPAQSVPPTSFILKIDHIQFDSNLYEKHVAVEAIGGNRLDANKAPQVGNAPTPSPT